MITDWIAAPATAASAQVRRLTASASPIADPAEARAFLDANPDVQFFEVIFTALSGVPRG